MSETRASNGDYHEPGHYEIRIKGLLDDRWADWFEGLTITLEANGDTLLTGPVVDQAALHRLLRKVRDLGMTLLSVNLRSERKIQVSSPTYLQRMGGAAAVIHGVAYLVSIIFFLVLLSPTLNADTDEYMAFVADNHVLMRGGILIAYWLTGGTVVILALALHERLKIGAPAVMQVATVFALIWAGLCIGSANLMINDFGVVAELYGKNPSQAATVWSALEAVEIGIVSGNEIIGSLWVLLVSLAALRTRELAGGLNYLGIVLGAAGIFTSLLSFVMPETKDLIMIFGLGMIFWSIWVGTVMLRTRRDMNSTPQPIPAQRLSR